MNNNLLIFDNERTRRPFLWQISQINRENAFNSAQKEWINNNELTEEHMSAIQNLLPEINFIRLKKEARATKPFLWKISQIDRKYAFELSQEEWITNYEINETQLNKIRELIPDINFIRIKKEARDNKPFLWQIEQINRTYSFDSAQKDWENMINKESKNLKLINDILGETIEK